MSSMGMEILSKDELVVSKDTFKKRMCIELGEGGYATA